MALAYCLETIDNGHDAQLTVYGEFLENNPPQYAARIVENSSWSCVHGVERWRSDCGCSSGTPGYHQRWRAPLREALDWLRDKMVMQFEYEAAKLLKDPWKARNDYIAVILDRSRPSVERWLAQHSVRPLSPEECTRALKLLESQRCAMLMYTSCGWFFDEISGLEGTQILRYAARAIDLIYELTGLSFEKEFLRLLEKAPSNVPELQNGKRIYELLVKPSRVSFERLAAHYGMVAPFPYFPLKVDKGCWNLTGKTKISGEPGKDSQAFAAGEVEVANEVTWEKKAFLFAANYRGGVSVVCGVAPYQEASQKFPRDLLEDAGALREIFSASNNEKMVERFGHNIFSLRHILSDARAALLDKLLWHDTQLIENNLRTAVHNYDDLFEYLTSLAAKVPAIIGASASIVLTADVIHSLEEEIPDVESIRHHMNRARQWNIQLDGERIGFTVSTWLTKQTYKIHDAPANFAEIERTCDVLRLFLDEFKLHLSLYEAQNLYYATEMNLRTRIDDPTSPEMFAALRKLGRLLRFSDETLR
jgi:hypothetical protein